jgi:hypothetical protein
MAKISVDVVSIDLAKEVCESFGVSVVVEKWEGPNGWPVVTLSGFTANVNAALKEMGYDDIKVEES